jgi:hypothetical protein
VPFKELLTHGEYIGLPSHREVLRKEILRRVAKDLLPPGELKEAQDWLSSEEESDG